MKITFVEADNRKREFLVRVGRSKQYNFPYSKAEPEIEREQVTRAEIDPELGAEAVRFETESGKSYWFHIEQVLEYHSDPGYLADLLLYQLTVECEKRVETSGLSRRQIARRLGTSVPQLYRLMDTTNYNKSMKQMVSLLTVLGAEVALTVS